MQILLKNVRIAFPKIWEPESFGDDGKPACSASFIIEPDNKLAMQTATDVIKKVAAEKWTVKGAETLKTLRAKNAICLHDGEEKSQYEGFPGNYFVSARNKVRPVVVDRDRSPLTQADGRPYAGCYVNVSLDIWPQDNKYGKRINATLLSVQFVKDGTSFSGGATGSANDFEDLGDDDDDAPAAGAEAGAGAGAEVDPLFG